MRVCQHDNPAAVPVEDPKLFTHADTALSGVLVDEGTNTLRQESELSQAIQDAVQTLSGGA